MANIDSKSSSFYSNSETDTHQIASDASREFQEDVSSDSDQVIAVESEIFIRYTDEPLSPLDYKQDVKELVHLPGLSRQAFFHTKF